VVLHGNPDDLVSQPAGNAGPRIGCGVVTLMNMASGAEGFSGGPHRSGM
jgi:hypothetical protein